MKAQTGIVTFKNSEKRFEYITLESLDELIDAAKRQPDEFLTLINEAIRDKARRDARRTGD